MYKLANKLVAKFKFKSRTFTCSNAKLVGRTYWRGKIWEGIFQGFHPTVAILYETLHINAVLLLQGSCDWWLPSQEIQLGPM